MGFVVEMVLEAVLEVMWHGLLEPVVTPVGRALSRVWSPLVQWLDGGRVLLLWAAVVAAMILAWRLLERADGGSLLGVLLFIGTPVLAIILTLEWRDTRRQRMHSRRLRRNAIRTSAHGRSVW